LSNGRFLVVAANKDMRQSLAFALETAGFTVTSRPDIPGADGARGYDGVILDHRAALPNPSLTQVFCSRSRYLIILASRRMPWLTDLADEVLTTPVAGSALVGAALKAMNFQSPAPA
jgi:hypothetical protein